MSNITFETWFGIMMARMEFVATDSKDIEDCLDTVEGLQNLKDDFECCWNYCTDMDSEDVSKEEINGLFKLWVAVQKCSHSDRYERIELYHPFFYKCFMFSANQKFNNK